MISTHFYHPHLRQYAETMVKECTIYQQFKLARPGYGQLPPHEAPLALWDEVAVVLIGPWSITINGQELTFNALMCIDPVTNLTEPIQIANHSSAHVAMQFKNKWLAWYP